MDGDGGGFSTSKAAVALAKVRLMLGSLAMTYERIGKFVGFGSIVAQDFACVRFQQIVIGRVSEMYTQLAEAELIFIGVIDAFSINFNIENENSTLGSHSIDKKQR